MPQYKEAFVYCWTDHKTNMLYVGYHKGRQDDGYICSSKWMLEEYKKRPEDFTRMILAEGNMQDCQKLETEILKTTDAQNDPNFYNKHNGEPWSHAPKFGKANPFYGMKHKESTKKYWSDVKKGKRHTEYTKKKIGDSNRGQKRSAQARKNISNGAIRKFEDDKQRKKVSVIRKAFCQTERGKLQLLEAIKASNSEKSREKKSKGMKKHYEEHPELRVARSKASKEQWAKRKNSS